MTIFGPHKARNRQEVPFHALLSAEFANSVPGVSLFLADHETGHVFENSPNLYRLGIPWTLFFSQKFCFFWRLIDLLVNVRILHLDEDPKITDRQSKDQAKTHTNICIRKSPTQLLLALANMALIRPCTSLLCR